MDCHVSSMADNQLLAFPIFDITLMVFIYNQNFFLMCVLRVVVDFYALENRKCYILTRVVCNIYNNYDT